MAAPTSLNGLRAFEAAARCGSFAGAGAELHVSPAAISRLVKILEARLQILLFRRGANRLELTEAGRQLSAGLTEIFGRLSRLVETVAKGPALNLTLGVGPTLAMRWLIPRLIRFQRRHPEIEIRLATALPGGPLMREEWTASIRPGAGDWAGLAAEPLFRARSFPVVAPKLAGNLAQPTDLARQALLRVVGAERDWPLWLSCAGVPELTNDSGPLFDSAALALQAALDGLGVAMAREPFVADDLAAGRLIRPFDTTIEHDRAWYFIYRESDRAHAAVIAFRNWLFDELSP